MARRVAAAALSVVVVSVGLGAPVTVGSSMPELELDGRPLRQVAWPDLEHGTVTLHLPDDAAVDATGPAVLACTDPWTGKETRAGLTALGTRDGSLRLDVAAAIPSMPYPIDALRLESKPAAIMSQQARRSVALQPADELRQRFRDTAAYMLQTAHHHYRIPFGDGSLACTVSIGDGAASGYRWLSNPFEVSFGRGHSVGPYPRSTAAVAAASWPAWVVDAADVPPDLAEAVEAALAAPLIVFDLDTSVVVARRRTDDGGAPGPWINLALGIIGTRGTNPPRAARALALVSVAISDALRIRRSLADAAATAEPGAPGIGEHHAAAGAAAAVLRALYPDDATLVDEAEARALAAWPEEDPIGHSLMGRQGSSTGADPIGIAAMHRLGSWVGEQVAARAAADGAGDPWEGTVPAADDLWRSAVPGGPPPVEPLAGTWRPWTLDSGAALRAAAPPRPGDAAFEAELREVWRDGRPLTLDEQQIASFWEDKYGSFTPPGHWTALALHQVRADGWSSDQAAVLFATLATAQADAFISAWDAKYAYWSVRPVTAIRDLLDATWSPYIPTPNFPSYVSGHSATSAAAATVLAAWFPDAAEELQACASQAAHSRLLGGIHFRSDNAVGLELGAAVAQVGLARLDVDALTADLPAATRGFECAWTSSLG